MARIFVVVLFTLTLFVWVLMRYRFIFFVMQKFEILVSILF